ncbi:MAG: hypothetical protein ABGX44_07430 [Candidatus Poseidoniia archaeon]|nr:hypothetical protein [Candidatus Poseidoniales archaeon]
MSNAQSYYENLIAQGHTPEQATTQTQQYFPDFQLGAATPTTENPAAPPPAMVAPAEEFSEEAAAFETATQVGGSMKATAEPMKFLSKTLPLIVILFVSAAAFASGFYSNSTNEKGESARQEANSLISAADKMESQADMFYDYDLSRDQLAYQLLDAAFNLHLQYLAIEGSDAEQEQYLMDQIHYNLFVMNEHTASTYSYDIDDVFLFTEDETVNYAFLEEDGYNYQLLKSDWNDFFLVDLTNTSQHMMDYGFDEYWVDNTFENYQPVNGFAVGPDLMFVNFTNLDDLLNGPIDEVRSNAGDKNREADEYEGDTRYIASAVAVTAVAAVLTTQMASRIKAKALVALINQLRYDILKDEEVLDSGADSVSLLVLALAAILTAAGLVMAFF